MKETTKAILEDIILEYLEFRVIQAVETNEEIAANIVNLVEEYLE